MIEVFEFSNWNQLAGLKSATYPNLKITVDQFNSDNLIGTKINIVDTRNNLTYFSGFIRVIKSTIFDSLAVFEVDEIIKRINSYGFNIAIIDPLRVPPNVITVLKGLLGLGYNFLTLQYIKTYTTESDSVYEYAVDEKYKPEYIYSVPEDELRKSPYMLVSNKYLVASKYLGDVPNPNSNIPNQPKNDRLYVVSQSPDFNWEDYKWVKPTVVYSISEVIEHSEPPLDGGD